jgi:hypothetical protein
MLSYLISHLQNFDATPVFQTDVVVSAHRLVVVALPQSFHYQAYRLWNYLGLFSVINVHLAYVVLSIPPAGTHSSV